MKKLLLALSCTIYFLIISNSGLKATQPKLESTVAPIIALNESRSWLEYNSEVGKFVVKFPGQPEQTTSNLPIAEQDTEWIITRFKSDTEHYTVAYTDLETEIIQLGANTVIDSIENALETDFNWSALNGRGKSIMVGEYPAREIIGIRDNKISIVRLILADQRLYVVMVTSENLGQIDQFLESFAVQPWQPYISEAGRFKVNLPTTPGEEQDSTELIGQLFQWNLIEARNFTNPGDSYSVGYTDISPEYLQDDPDALLKKVGDNLLEKFSETTIIENGKEITLDGYPGRSYLVAIDSEQIFVVRFYLVDNRLYGIGSTSDNIGNIHKFMDSFEIGVK